MTSDEPTYPQEDGEDTPTPETLCQHLRLKPDVSAETSVIAIGFRLWGVTCEDCGRKWDVGQVLQSVVDFAAYASRLAEAENKLRSEFRCRGLTDAEIASEFAALAHDKEKP